MIQCMTRRLCPLALAVAGVMALTGTAGAVTREVQVRFGDKVTGTLEAGGDSVGIRFFSVEGAKGGCGTQG